MREGSVRLRQLRNAAGTIFLASLASSPVVGAASLVAAVDHNGDGLVYPVPIANYNAPADQTSADRPFLFWLNDDQDDLELYESWPHESPDNADNHPGSLRDLEDLTRLVVAYPDWSTLDPESTELHLRWVAREGPPPVIRLWRSGIERCSRSYLEETEMGLKQLQAPYAGALGVVDGESLRLPLSLWSEEERSREWLCLLFEGAGEGRGALQVELHDGVTVRDVSPPVHMEIRPLKSFYERVAVHWPQELKPPWTYFTRPPIPALKAVPEPMGVEFRPPWYETDDVIVWVHGWIPQDPDNYRRTLVFSFETMWKRLWHQGFRGRVIHFRWPTVKKLQMFGLHISEYRAYKSAPALLDFVETLPTGRKVHVTTHSLGGVLLMEAIKLGLEVEQALFQVSAVAAESFDPDESLVIDEMADLSMPRDASAMGHAGYVTESRTPIYSAYNPADATWLGWNAAQRATKPLTGLGSRYAFEEDEGSGGTFTLRRPLGDNRRVDDPHEAMALAVPARSQALGGEGRVAGVVEETFNLHHPPFEFESDHVAMWRWNPQKVLPYSNLILDVFNIPYNDAGLSGSMQ